MWSDNEDLVVIADMYQVKIKVITTKGSSDKNPTTSWIHPDEKLEKFAELSKKVDLNDMVLLHENDTHFNLFISKNSDLARLGSLCYRFDAGPIRENEEVDDNCATKVTEADEEEENILKKDNLKKELKKCKEGKKHIENEYYKCEKELRNKTVEVEKLKIELKEIMRLKKEVKDNGIDNTSV